VPGIEPGPPDLLPRTLTTRPQSDYDLGTEKLVQSPKKSSKATDNDDDDDDDDTSSSLPFIKVAK
jgi:hypothetical protein